VLGGSPGSTEQGVAHYKDEDGDEDEDMKRRTTTVKGRRGGFPSFKRQLGQG
jgi:hypothetical protein